MTTPAPLLNGMDINLAARATRDVLDALLDQAGLTFPEWVAMQTLAAPNQHAERPALVTDLATRLRIDPAAVAEVLDSLATSGLIADERLTPSGAALCARIQAGIGRITATLYADFAPEDLATTRRVLLELTDRAPRLRVAL
jgi:DNA-binding MarR family transcriptional regulator